MKKTTLINFALIAIAFLFTTQTAKADEDLAITPTTVEISDYSFYEILFASLDGYPIEQAHFDISESENGEFFTIAETGTNRSNYGPIQRRFSVQFGGSSHRNISATLNFKLYKRTSFSATISQRSVFVGVRVRFGRSLNFDNIAEYIVADILALKPQEKSILLIS